MALTKKVRAAGSSRFSDSMKSTVVPSLSTALSHPYAIRHHSVVCNAFERLQKIRQIDLLMKIFATKPNLSITKTAYA